MRAITSLTIVFVFIVCSSIHAQEFPQYTSLREQAYSAFREKHYTTKCYFRHHTSYRSTKKDLLDFHARYERIRLQYLQGFDHLLGCGFVFQEVRCFDV